MPATTTAVAGAVAPAPRWYAHGFNRAVVYRMATRRRIGRGMADAASEATR